MTTEINLEGILRKGVQRIIEKYPRAFYVPCACHALNLVMNYTVFLLYKAFTLSGSINRWEVLKNVSQLTLKPLSGTRWSSRVDE